MKTSLWSCEIFVRSVFFAASGALLFSLGCGKTNVANAQTPPPQSLSEPVRPIKAEISPAPLIPISDNTLDLADQKPGESRALPVFVPPTPPPAPAVAVRAIRESPLLTDNASKGKKCHILAKGETIYALSKMYNVKPKDIIAANQFKDPNHLVVGTKIYIP
ncbi:MAG: LysM peptidoglycan-binding domain-containing protein [Planctomycetota bacterium]